MSIFLVIFMYALWSSIFPLGKIALQSSPPIFFTGFRMTLAGIIILLYLFFIDRSSFKLIRRHFLSFSLLAIFSVYLTNVLEFWGLKYLTAAKTSFIYSLSPFFTAFLSYLHFKEKMSIYKWIGLSIGFIGFIPALALQTDAEELLNAFSFISWPAIAVIGASLCSVYGWVLFRLIIKDSDISPITVNGISMFIGGVIALLHSFLIESWSFFPIPLVNLIPFFKSALIIILISNIICYNLYGLMLKKFTATFLSFVGLLSPIFASIAGWIFLGEQPSWTIFLSTGLVSIGLSIMYHIELKHGYIK